MCHHPLRSQHTRDVEGDHRTDVEQSVSAAKHVGAAAQKRGWLEKLSAPLAACEWKVCKCLVSLTLAETKVKFHCALAAIAFQGLLSILITRASSAW